MRARELARQRIEVAHALYGNEERFIATQAGLGQLRQLIAEMGLELLDIGAVERLAASHVGAPLRDLLLEWAIVECRHAVQASIQMPRSVLSTACHCCRWAASCARDLPL